MLNKNLLDQKARAVQDRLLLTDQAVRAIQRGAHDLYDEIAHDIEPQSRRDKTVSRDVIIEIVLDAGRLEEKFRYTNVPVANAIRNMSYRDLIDLVGPSFAYERYEVGSG